MSFQVTGKFFARSNSEGDDSPERFEFRGATFGPFPPSEEGIGLPPRAAIDSELAQVASSGLNALRVYEVPPLWFLDACEKADLAVLVGIPWTQHVDFLKDREARKTARARVIDTVRELGGHPAVFAFLVGNEIEGGLVRWMGPARVRDFLEDLIERAREATESEVLLSYASYPTTEYLFPRNADFVTFNVYLEEEENFRSYLQRLQHLAGDKPLLLGEFGFDSKGGGEASQAEVLDWSVRVAREAGCAGHITFAWSDLWHRGGNDITGWDFGLVDRSGNAKPALAALRSTWSEALGSDAPSFSVVVCTHNGTSTLDRCLAALEKLDPPPLEVLIVDDGSTKDIKSIAENYPEVRYFRQDHGGLSSARNRGAEEAKGEIVAYIDDDAFAFPDWLAHLALAFRDPECACAGGPNIPPPTDTFSGELLANAPGRPSHVMLDDFRAEHLPGCNLAVRRSDWLEVGGFDPRFRAAGDDVDFCWRLIDAGREIHFAAGAVVWHLPRGTVRAYLRQQGGYGLAEALLREKHDHRFHNGQIAWRGAVYGGTARLRGAMVYFGRFGAAPFQGIVYGPRHPFPGFGATRGLPAFAARALGRMGRLARAWKRKGPLFSRGAKSDSRMESRGGLKELSFWSEDNVGREELLAVLSDLAKEQGWRVESGDGWQLWDFRLTRPGEEDTAVSFVSEYHGDGKVRTRVRLEGLDPVAAQPLVLDSAQCLALKPMS